MNLFSFFSKRLLWLLLPLLFYLAPVLRYAPYSLAAHELWVEKNSGWLLLHYGHRTEAKDGPGEIAYDPATVKKILCLRDDRIRVLPVRTSERRAGTQEACDTILFDMDGGHYTKTPYGTVKKSKEKTRYPLKSWISHESVKEILRFSKAATRPLREGLEITPPEGIEKAGPGEKLTFLVTLDGRPLPALPVAINGEVRGQTDSKGRINLRIRRNGFQSVTATRRILLNRIDADEELYTATLGFRVMP